MISIWLFLLLKEHNSFKDEFHQEIILPKSHLYRGVAFFVFSRIYMFIFLKSVNHVTSDHKLANSGKAPYS
jgi:hypothetical protein